MEQQLEKEVEINFINMSDEENFHVVIFQKNIAAPDQVPIVWRVITNLKTHRLILANSLSVSMTDSWGNNADLNAAAYGQKWNAINANGNYELVLDNSGAQDPESIEMVNALSKGNLALQVFKKTSLLAEQTGMSPGQTAVFKFKPTIWVGLSGHIEEGERIDLNSLNGTECEFSLAGVKKARLIMTGGGESVSALPVKFDLVPDK